MDKPQNLSSLSPEQKRVLLAELLREKARQPNVVPASFAQGRMWFLDKLYPDSPTNSIPAAVQLLGPLNVAALRLAFNQIVQRHESLRTTLDEINGKLVQRILPGLELELPILDFTTVAEPERDHKVRERLNAEALKPFDLTQGPLLRILLLQVAPDDHILMLNMHHIVSDWWSMQILLRELSLLYDGHVTGQPVDLPELPLRFSDYVLWQEQQLETPAAQAALDYWVRELANAPAALELPTDAPRPAVQTTAGAYASVPVPSELGQKLKSLCREQRVTPFMLLLAALDVLLKRYTGQDDILVGTSMAGRERAESQGLIGFLTNTIVIRANLAGDPPFSDLLARVREGALQAFRHQDVPFEKLVELLRPERDLSHTPLFQVLFVYDHALIGSLQLTNLTLRPVEINTATAKFDLTLFMRETAAGLRATVQYNSDLFRAETITRLLGHYLMLLEGIVAAPDQRISLLPLLTEVEKAQTLVEWNQTAGDYSPDTCIHTLFEDQVTRTPKAVAVVFGDETLTYEQLNNRSNRLAHVLQTEGVGPEMRVGVYMERSLEMVVGLMAILKAGGAYLPLDPAYPPDRLDFMIKDSQVRLVLTTEQRLPELADKGLEVICVDRLEDRSPGEGVVNPKSTVCPDNLAYVIYTSGSTGKPKGAMLHHRGICNRLLWGITDYRLGAGDRVLSKTPISFDVSVWEIFAPLSCGACIVIARQGGEQDSAYLVELIRDQRVTHADFVPSMLQPFLSTRDVESCVHLKRITAAGEALSVDLQEQFFAKLKAELYNLYGPTEASLAVTFWACRQVTSLRSIPIGRPMSNVQIYVLDEYLQPVPVGISGELHIGGIAVGRGYLNRPDLTAEKFIPDPFGPAPGSRLYKTGDLVRHSPDGNLEFLGRRDQQVKVRGFRIELGEIEAILSTCPAVREVVVVTRQDRSGNQRLLGYIVPKQPSFVLAELRSFLKERLPEYMIPSVFVVLEAMPLTQNGKADRQALPAPDSVRPDLEVIYTPPATALEQTIAAVWQDVLGLEQVGNQDNFFDLGGHSLLLIQVQHKLQEALGESLSIVNLFKYPTIAQLAAFLREDEDMKPALLQVKERSQKKRAATQRRKSAAHERGRLDG